MAQLKVAVLNAPPWIKLNTAKDGTVEMTGQLLPMWNYICRSLNISYEFVISLDENYGFNTNGSWTGVMGMIARKEADILLAPMIATHERKEIAAFTYGFYYTPTSILSRKPSQNLKTSLGLLFNVSVEVPVLTVMLLLVILFIWKADEGFLFEKKTSCLKILWSYVFTIFGKPLTTLPKGGSSRLASAFWLVGIFFVICCYTAQLQANYTVIEEAYINDLEDILKNPSIKPIVVAKSIYIGYFQSSVDSLFQAIHHRATVTGGYGAYETVQDPSILQDVRSGNSVLIELTGDIYNLLADNCNNSPDFYLADSFLWQKYSLATTLDFDEELFHKIDNKIKIFAQTMFWTPEDRLVLKNASDCLWKKEKNFGEQCVQSVTVIKVVAIFYTWFLGCFLSLLIFLSELIVSYCLREKRKNSLQSKRLDRGMSFPEYFERKIKR